jgi:hypothetical protein
LLSSAAVLSLVEKRSAQPYALNVIPEIVHQTAPTHRLTWEEARITKRIRRMLPGWAYRLWSNAEQEELFDSMFPEYVDQFRQIPFGMARADLARYAILSRHGGFYFDTDYKLLKKISGDWLNHSAILPVEYVHTGKDPTARQNIDLGSALLASEPGFPLWKDLICHIFENHEPEKLSERFNIPGVTGPMALTHFYLANEDQYPDVCVAEKNVFLPDIWLLSLCSSADEKTMGIHLTFGSWRERGLVNAVKTIVRRKLNGLLS